MKIVNPNSLAATIDAINEAYFFEKPLPKSQKEKAAKWIANRQGLPHSYRGLFAPTERDFRQGFKLFTGERVRTGGEIMANIAAGYAVLHTGETLLVGD
jgi:hypothetical protein